MARTRTRGPRRRTIWSRTIAFETVAVAGAELVLPLVDQSANVLFTESTVTRVVGSVFLRSTDVGPWEGVEYAIGIVPVTEQAVAVGVTALPNPGTNLDADWMYWRASQLWGTGPPTDDSSNLYQERIELDIHGQRRLREGGNDLVLMFSNQSAFSITMSTGLSVLIKLP